MGSSKLTVAEVSESLQRFGIADYIVFVASLLVCVVIGVYFGWKDWSVQRKRKQNVRRGSEALNYLVGGRKMKIFPVAMSLIASFISGIAVMGASTETYLHGTQFCYIFTGIMLMAVSMNFIFLPVYQGLEITSAYAYLQLRFDRRIRLLGSGLFTLATLLHLPIVIYVPALAFNQVSGVNVHIVSTSVCMVCIFYTLVGGIKAVVWTDVIQMFIMIGALILIVVKGTAEIGGLGVLIERNMASGRFEAPNLDPTERHTIWAIFIGGGSFWMGKNAIHQMMIQRYLALPTFRDAQKALVCFTVGIILLLMTCFYNGLLIYATFYDCDPLTTGLAKAKDQLLPVLLMKVLGNYPGLAGLFSLSERSTRYIMRGTVLAFGIVAVVLVLVVEKLGTVLQLSMSLVPISLGPLLGLFLLGMLLPWVDSTSALGGAICGLFTMSYIVIRAQIAVAAKEMPILAKPVSVEGCEYEFELPPGYNTTATLPTPPIEKSIHHVSYLFYTFIGAVTTVLVGSITAAILRRQQPGKLDPLLLAPFVRKIYFPESIPRTIVTTHTFNKEDTELYVVVVVGPQNVVLVRHSYIGASYRFKRSSGRMADVTILDGNAQSVESIINEDGLFTTESVKRPGPSVEDISRSLQRFNWPDYVVFVLMLISCMVIGVFFGYKDHQKHKRQKHARRGSEALDYLVGGRKMKIIPVAVSLVASWISGISLLGTSTEIYVYGVQYCYIVCAVVLMGLSMNYIFLPVFHDLQITSAYEYLQMRFDKRMRLVGSILFTLASILWLPIVIYVPALAFNQVSGVNIHVITPIVCLVCIFYTSLGGLKAVVWTDVIQTGIMVGAMIIVIIKGTADVGGLSVVIERNSAGGRFEAPDFNPDPTARNTFWTLLIGGTFFWTSTNAINQNMMQRYLSLPSLGSARKALVLFLIGTTTLLAMCCYNGLLIFAMYHDCDPLTTGLAKAKDQLVPLLVMEVLGEYPGLAGLFVAGIFSAALSSLSTALNSLSAIVLEDFCKPFVSKPLTETQTRYIMRFTVLAFGALAVMMVIVVEKMGAVLQLSMSLGPVTLGPLFGLFLMGFFFPRINGSCAIVGTTAGLALMSYIVIRSQISIALKEIVFAEKPVTVSGCQYEFTPKNGSLFVEDSTPGEKSLHHVSFLYYTMIGSVVPTIVGYLSSFVLPRSKTDDIDPLLLAPFLRRFYHTRDSKANHMTEVLHEFETKDIQL
uniref:Sodium/solute symporter n=1 Tax=Anopheles stephensi TaxID=30069 RepID=A0A182XVS6_ANOST